MGNYSVLESIFVETFGELSSFTKKKIREGWGRRRGYFENSGVFLLSAMLF